MFIVCLLFGIWSKPFTHGIRHSNRYATDFVNCLLWRSTSHEFRYFASVFGHSRGMFTSTVWTSFSMILFWPVIATGLFDRDVTDEQAIRFPALYETGRLGLDPSRSFICLGGLGICWYFWVCIWGIHIQIHVSVPSFSSMIPTNRV